ncbi:uncharacterized protein LOC126884105 [Diabrotica virgifera virgifera]|uniref:MADF domain-containing protein n=1 Tax=Diabrotica virgifera virgifera TaxID=50390 RepID=A0ABM5K6P5_DIAVI|nr:uncharacterized protein LOC126884105 [Diabrotica virgifera virgifera]
MDDKIEMLIGLIRGYPHLYDKSNRNFKDQHMKENSWKKIAEGVEMTVKDCQRLWLNLRNKYGREKKALPSGSGAPATPQWEYFDSMSFINKYVKPRHTHTRTAEIARTVNECTQPLKSPVFESSCSSNAWANSTIIESNADFQTQGDDMSESDQANETQDEEMYEENIVIQMEEAEDTEEVRHPVHAETAKVADKGKKKKTINGPDTAEVIDAAKAISQHLKNLVGQAKQPKTPSDILGEYIASVLKEMPPEKQKRKRNRLLEVLLEDD